MPGLASLLRAWATGAALLALASLPLVSAAGADPVKIRLGIGTAAEEPLWLLLARPDLAPHEGKSYTLDYVHFAGADKRFQAFVADAIDLATMSGNGSLYAAAEGIPFKIIASLSRESPRGFYTKFMVLANSPLRTIRDLAGKKIGVNGFGTGAELYTTGVLRQNGMSEKDVRLVPLPFAAQGEGLRSGEVDVATFPQPYAAIMLHQGGVRTLFTSKDAAPYEEELVMLIGNDDFLKANRAAVRDLLADLVGTTHYYLAHTAESRKALIAAKLVRVDPEIYLGMEDYYRDPGARVDAAALEHMQELQLSAGFQKNRADLAGYIDLSYLPN